MVEIPLRMTNSHEMNEIYPVPEEIAASTTISRATYTKMYEASLTDPDGFWREQAERISWFRKPTKIKNVSFKGDVSINWYEDGILNVCYNCIDRHLPARANQTAIIFEGDDPSVSKHISYQTLHDEVCRLAHLLKNAGVQKGDRVMLYMPMIPEATYAMLACARIGAVHSVVFGGFSPEALADRIKDADAKVIITADAGVRGGKTIRLKANVDAALQKCQGSEFRVLVFKHTNEPIQWVENQDLDARLLMNQAPTNIEPEPMNAEDPLFILYTSGSTGKPKGVLHTTGGYLVYVSLTYEYIFDYREGDIYWCTADVGWVTGHSYIVYGPLANGATTLVFEGIPTYPNASRFWDVVDKHQVNIFYTAPTAIRALMRAGDEFVTNTSRASLRILGSVGEPINPEAWRWYHRVVGESRCPIVDTWWQTETGGALISPLPGATALKPGSATLPLFGVQPELRNAQGDIIEGPAEGSLCLKDSWPGQMRTIFRDHERFKNTYFTTYEGRYFTGDGARRDEDGYYWITGRVDDVINVSGHRLGTAEIESALVGHSAVAEAAVVGYPDDIKGQGIYCYVTVKSHIEESDTLRDELVQWVRQEIGPFAKPDFIQWAGGLPKTRSGKIMRRILRKIAANEYEALGDTSTLADPTVVDDLIHHRKDM
ncbi:MAG: acetate--CoA ligase [Myxococcales bacterium]|nr:acetate--CoA ligase [Myxococcales bacterium]